MGKMLGAMVLSLVVAGSVAADTFTVNDTADQVDATVGDGICDADADTAGEQCTLRAAVQEANASAAADLVTVPAGTYALTIKGAGEDAAASGDLDLFGVGVSIEGAGAATTIIDGKKLKDRLVHVHSAATLRGLTLQRGKVPAAAGDGGGCVRNQGTLTIEDAVLTNCKAKDDAGALDNQLGSLTVAGTVFEKNKTKDDGGAVDVDEGTAAFTDVVFTGNKAGDEGGAFESSGGFVVFTRVAFEGNKARKEGGAVSNEDGGQVDFVDCTLAGNKAKRGGGVTTSTDTEFGISVTRALGTNFDGNKKRNCDGPVTDLGGNTDSDGSCHLGSQ